MRDRWQENRRASSAKDDVNRTRWKQLVKAMEVTGSKKQVISCNMEGNLYIWLSYFWKKLVLDEI